MLEHPRSAQVRASTAVRVRRVFLLAVVLFVLATAVPDSAGTSRTPRRRDPRLQDDGPVPYSAT